MSGAGNSEPGRLFGPDLAVPTLRVRAGGGGGAVEDPRLGSSASGSRGVRADLHPPLTPWEKPVLRPNGDGTRDGSVNVTSDLRHWNGQGVVKDHKGWAL